ncbi:MAG: glycerol-3-phosphate 1-O-acyltransferase PlsY [Lachnospiraceae bacterium]|nr:glycerol-3-phosphate 1-O-acyltransferase PlsY [Lachnospiraceae bacterium]
MIWVRIVCLVIGYAFGLFQTGYIYSRAKGVDIRQHGSGNVGTTNLKRVLGVKAGVITYIGDALKLLIAVFLVMFVFRDSGIDVYMLAVYTALGCVLGHNFPFYLKFKGGKGIAVTSALVISTLDWRYILISFGIFFLVVGITRMVSLGSLCLVSSFFVSVLITTQLGYSKYDTPFKYETYIILAIITALAYFQHRANIKRIANGTESKFTFKKKPDVEI